MGSESDLVSSQQSGLIKSEQHSEFESEMESIQQNLSSAHNIENSELDYAELDPELYGLRRSGRGGNKHDFQV